MSPTGPGFRATVIALAAGQAISWATLFYTFSSFVLPMQTALGWDKPQIMGAFTLGLAVYGAASYAVGAAIDAGRGRAVLSGGAALGGVGFLIWSQASTLAMLYLAWALLGAAMAMTLYEPAFNVLTKRFPSRYVQGITALTLVGGFASTLSFPAATWLIGHFGWRAALVTIGAVLLVVNAPLHAWALRGTPVTATSAATHGAAAESTLHEALRMRAFWLLTAAFTLYAFAVAAMWAHMIPAFVAKGRTEVQAIAVLVWVGPAQVAGRIALTLFGRRIALHSLGVGVLAALAISLAIFALADRMSALFVFALLFGVANGMLTIVRGSLMPRYFGRRHLGRISGAMTGISMFARASAPVTTAWLLLALPGYRELLLVLACVATSSLLAFAFAGKPA